MIRSALPIMHLAEPPARQSSSRASTASGLDAAFVLSSALVLIGGSFLLLEMASARSKGHDSVSLQFLTDASIWLPSMVSLVGKYIALFVASIVNSGLIVLLVQSLRGMDHKMSRVIPRVSLGNFRSTSQTRSENVRGKRASQRREASAIRITSPFLLSPVFR